MNSNAWNNILLVQLSIMKVAGIYSLWFCPLHFLYGRKYLVYLLADFLAMTFPTHSKFCLLDNPNEPWMIELDHEYLSPTHILLQPLEKKNSSTQSNLEMENWHSIKKRKIKLSKWVKLFFTIFSTTYFYNFTIFQLKRCSKS